MTKLVTNGKVWVGNGLRGSNILIDQNRIISGILSPEISITEEVKEQ